MLNNDKKEYFLVQRWWAESFLCYMVILGVMKRIWKHAFSMLRRLEGVKRTVTSRWENVKVISESAKEYLDHFQSRDSSRISPQGNVEESSSVRKLS